jgi:hypothetical protein
VPLAPPVLKNDRLVELLRDLLEHDTPKINGGGTGREDNPP